MSNVRAAEPMARTTGNDAPDPLAAFRNKPFNILRNTTSIDVRPAAN